MKCMIYTVDGHNEPIEIDCTLEEFVDSLAEQKASDNGWLMYEDRIAIQVSHIVRIVKYKE